MRFPVFSGDSFMPQHQCRGGCPNRGTPSSQSPFSSWPADAFIPVMMMGSRPRGRRESHHQHTPRSPPRQMPSFCHGDSPPRQMPSFCRGDSCRSQPVVDKAFKMAQDFLGEIFGQPGCPSRDATAPKRGESEEKPSTQCSGQGNCCRETPNAASCHKTTSGEAQKPACQERKTGSQPYAQSAQKTEEQHAAGKSARSHLQETPAQWSHSLYFSGLTPDKVSIKAKNGKVFIRAFQEKLRGPSTCLSKVEVTRTVTLPENVDHKTLTCTMKQDGTLVLRAHLKDSQAGKKETDKPENDTSPQKDEKEVDNAENNPEKEQTTTNMPEKTEVSTEQQQNVTRAAEQKSEMHVLENERENLKALDNNTEGMQALENRSENTYALENKAGDLHTLKNKTEQDHAELCENKTEETMERPDGGEFQTSAGKNDGKTGEPDDVTAEEQYQHSGDEVEMTNMEWNHTASFPLIEEPDDESLSTGEDISQRSSMDFVVIDGDSVNTEKAEAGNHHGKNNEDIQTSEELPQDQTQATEEVVREQTNEEINTPDETDPTRPIKRTNSPEPTHNANEGLSTLGEHSHATTLAANPQHESPFQASLPLVGFNPGDVQVKLHDHTLRITAKRQSWLGDAPYMESVVKELELPGHLDVLTVRCVYQQKNGCLLVRADPQSPQRQVPVTVQ